MAHLGTTIKPKEKFRFHVATILFYAVYKYIVACRLVAVQ
jgi:hypothetical protein